MKTHQVHSFPFAGTDYAELYPQARRIYTRIKAQTKRQPYVRSSYFKKDKVFIELFWVHLNQKGRQTRIGRLKYYSCGIELLRNSKQNPVTKLNVNNSSEVLYRFAGITKGGDKFYIQIKENTRTKRKDFMSVFPVK